MSNYPADRRQFDELAAALFTDEDGHRIHAALWGGVAEKHNVNADGSPFGDCYKCRVIRDAVHGALRSFSGFES